MVCMLVHSVLCVSRLHPALGTLLVYELIGSPCSAGKKTLLVYELIGSPCSAGKKTLLVYELIGPFIFVIRHLVQQEKMHRQLPMGFHHSFCGCLAVKMRQTLEHAFGTFSKYCTFFNGGVLA